MDGSTKWHKTAGMLSGFALGLVLMFGQKALLGHDHEAHDTQGDKIMTISDIETALNPRGASIEGEGDLRDGENDEVPMLLDGQVRASVRRNVSARRVVVRTPSEEIAGVITTATSRVGGRPGEGGGAGAEGRQGALSSGSSLERMVSEAHVVANAVTIVQEMQRLSAKCHEILSDGADSTSRDDLDDELSEMHMYVGVLRRQISGAEPLTEEQHHDLSSALRKIDGALARLEGHLGGAHVSVDKTDMVLRAIESELGSLISKHIDSVQSFRRWQPVKVCCCRRPLLLVPAVLRLPTFSPAYTVFRNMTAVQEGCARTHTASLGLADF